MKTLLVALLTLGPLYGFSYDGGFLRDGSERCSRAQASWQVKGKEVQEIREKLDLDRHQLAEYICLSGYQAMMNIETDFRKPSKLTARLLRYLEGQPKKKALEFLEEFSAYGPK